MKYELPKTQHLVLNNDDTKESFEDLVRDIVQYVNRDVRTKSDA